MLINQYVLEEEYFKFERREAIKEGLDNRIISADKGAKEETYDGDIEKQRHVVEGTSMVKTLQKTIPMNLSEDKFECSNYIHNQWYIIEAINIINSLSGIAPTIEEIQAQQQVRQEEEKQAAINTVAGMSDSALVLTLGGAIMEANQGFKDMVGLNTSDLLGKNIRNILPPLVHQDQRTEVQNRLQDAISRGTGCSLPVNLVLPDQRIFSLRHGRPAKKKSFGKTRKNL